MFTMPRPLSMGIIFFWTAAACLQEPTAQAAEARWWKGNLHTHTLWSDGDSFPELVAEWYKEEGYHFLAISDHNIMLEGEKWIAIGTNASRQAALKKLEARFPGTYQARTNNGRIEVRLTGLEELKRRFETPGRFLLIPSEEISASFEELPIHINATNIRDLIEPRSGRSVYEVMQNNIDAVLAQRQRTGQAMFPHLNHPNFHFAVTAEDLMKVEGERFFEVYNGHPAVFNEGDETRPSTERIWDVVLAWRLAILNLEVMFGIAVDDSHQYHEDSPALSNPGRGWIMVQCDQLNPESIVHAMEAGDFYATTGVQLKNVKRTEKELSLEIKPEDGVEYSIEFIGSKRDFVIKKGAKPETNPERIGIQLAPPAQGVRASYRLKEDDLYVRAVVRSSKKKVNGLREDEVERAWTQPALAPRK